MKKIIILLSLLFLFEPLSYSGAKFSAASRNKQRLEKKAGKSAQLKNKPKFSGELQTFGAVYLEDTGAEDVFGEIRFLPEMSWQTEIGWYFFVQGDFRLDSTGYASGVFDGVEDNGRWIANIRQAYAEYSENFFKLRIGKQIFDWSVTDTVSPSDNISPRDWTDVIEWERVGVPAVQLRYGDMTFWELVYVPFATQSKFPCGRWDYDMPQGLIFGDINEPNDNYDQYALRVGVNVSNWDLGASYYHGYSYNPAVGFFPPNKITAEYIREDVVSLSAVGEIGAGVMFRAEAGYFNQHGDDDFVQLVVGADRFWNDVFRLTDEFYLLVQYVDEVEVNDISPETFQRYDFRRAFNRSVMARAQYTFEDTREWSVKLEGSYNFERGDSYIEPSVAWQKGNFKIEAGIGFAAGPKDTLWGGWRQNDRVFVQCSWYF